MLPVVWDGRSDADVGSGRGHARGAGRPAGRPVGGDPPVRPTLDPGPGRCCVAVSSHPS